MNSDSATRPSTGNRALCAFGLVLALGLLSGCGGGSPVVLGKVTYKKELLTTGEVSFIGADKKSRSGLIGSDGRYEIRDAPEGPVTPVTIVVVAEKTEGGAPQGSPIVGNTLVPATEPVTRSLVPQKYNDPQTSGLSFVVGRGKQTKNLELEE